MPPKATLKPRDVEDFLGRLNRIKHWVLRYARNRIYGAVAWLTADAGSEAEAEATVTTRPVEQASLTIEHLHGWFSGSLATHDEDEPYATAYWIGTKLSVVFWPSARQAR